MTQEDVREQSSSYVAFCFHVYFWMYFPLCFEIVSLGKIASPTITLTHAKEGKQALLNTNSIFSYRFTGHLGSLQCYNGNELLFSCLLVLLRHQSQGQSVHKGTSPVIPTTYWSFIREQYSAV